MVNWGNHSWNVDGGEAVIHWAQSWFLVELLSQLCGCLYWELACSFGVDSEIIQGQDKSYGSRTCTKVSVDESRNMSPHSAETGSGNFTIVSKVHIVQIHQSRTQSSQNPGSVPGSVVSVRSSDDVSNHDALYLLILDKKNPQTVTLWALLL